MRLWQEAVASPSILNLATFLHYHSAIHNLRALMAKNSPSDLGTRFHSLLPHELRAHIFSFLLVRSVKWNLQHLESCERRNSRTIGEYTRPTHHNLVGPDHSYICASCGPFTHERNWRHAFERGFEVYVSPWRSKWAPDQGNPYVCTNCYDDRLRSRPFPEPTNLPCLCARHKNLEVRLVCRQWNEEACGVFFSGNVFAFDDCVSMKHFFSIIPRHWIILITKVSLLFPLWHTEDDSASVDVLATSLSVLSSLTWLQHLELDAKLLNDEATTLALLDTRIPSLERVCFFVQSPIKVIPWREGLSPTYIWGELANRCLLVGGLPERVARSIKAQGVEAHSCQKTNKEEIRRQSQLYEFAQKNDQLWNINNYGRTILDCEAQKTDPPND